MFKHIVITSILILTISAESTSVKKTPINQNITLAPSTRENKSSSSIISQKNTLSVKKSSFTKKEATPMTVKMSKLLHQRNIIINQLLEKNKTLSTIIQQSHIWDNEIRVKTKGKLDTLIDQADRLHTSNHFRNQIIIQYKEVSKLINQLKENREKVFQQTIDDARKAEMQRIKNEHNNALEELAKAQKLLTEFHNNEKVEGFHLKNTFIRSITIEQETTVGNLAYEQYQDYDKWLYIYNYSDNKNKIPSKSEKAIIPKGTTLIIPNIK